MKNLVGKTIKLDLVGLDGNAFSLLGAFTAQAKREKWTMEEIAKVRNECMNGDYDHLLVTLLEHCDSPDEDDLGDEYE